MDTNRIYQLHTLYFNSLAQKKNSQFVQQVNISGPKPSYSFTWQWIRNAAANIDARKMMSLAEEYGKPTTV